jgi:hypothetical protein
MKNRWKDVRPLRRPNARWQVGNAARFFENFLGIPEGSIVFVKPDGKPVKPTETIGSLRFKRD